MLINSVSFVKSSTKWQDCPEGNIPEYAFIGRSNVGKSSLINAMMNHKNLAKTSQTPGKTQLINHFIVNESWYLTDLPGYGYAKTSKVQRKKFEKLIADYITQRKNLVNLFILVDTRHSPQKIDLEFMRWTVENEIPFSIVFTKSDKLKPSQIEKNIDIYSEELLKEWGTLPKLFITSSEKKEGGDLILDYIKQTNNLLRENNINFS